MKVGVLFLRFLDLGAPQCRVVLSSHVFPLGVFVVFLLLFVFRSLTVRVAAVEGGTPALPAPRAHSETKRSSLWGSFCPDIPSARGRSTYIECFVCVK